MMITPQKDSELSEDEIERRREAALKRMLNTPHKPHKPTKDSGKSSTKRGRPKKEDRS